jgi:hypothetical protein
MNFKVFKFKIKMSKSEENSEEDTTFEKLSLKEQLDVIKTGGVHKDKANIFKDSLKNASLRDLAYVMVDLHSCDWYLKDIPESFKDTTNEMLAFFLYFIEVDEYLKL